MARESLPPPNISHKSDYQDSVTDIRFLAKLPPILCPNSSFLLPVYVKNWASRRRGRCRPAVVDAVVSVRQDSVPGCTLGSRRWISTHQRSSLAAPSRRPCRLPRSRLPSPPTPRDYYRYHRSSRRSTVDTLPPRKSKHRRVKFGLNVPIWTLYIPLFIFFLSIYEKREQLAQRNHNLLMFSLFFIFPFCYTDSNSFIVTGRGRL